MEAPRGGLPAGPIAGENCVGRSRPDCAGALCPANRCPTHRPFRAGETARAGAAARRDAHRAARAGQPAPARGAGPFQPRPRAPPPGRAELPGAHPAAHAYARGVRYACEDIARLRLRITELDAEIGRTLQGLQPSPVHRSLRRHQAQRLSHLFPKPRRSFGTFAPLRPGELVGIDIKSFGSLGRSGGKASVTTPARAVASAGVICTSRSTWPAAWSSASPSDPRRLGRRGLPGSGHCVLRPTGNPHRARADRQRLGVQELRLPRCLRGRRNPPYPDEGPPPLDERSGGAVHRHDPARGARTETTPAPTPSGLWRSRCSFPGTTTTDRTPRSGDSRRRAG